jgi:hypothetical protein
MRSIPPSHADGITTGFTVKIDDERVRGVGRCSWQIQAGSSEGDIAQRTVNNTIADYDPCDLEAITSGVRPTFLRHIESCHSKISLRFIGSTDHLMQRKGASIKPAAI